jgi:hypothetical protein
VVTPPLVWPGGELLVNHDTRRNLASHPGYTGSYYGTGGVRAEVRDAAGKAIKGFTAADCPIRTGNTERIPGCYEPVRWGDRTMDYHRGKRVRLCLRLRDSHLYAFKSGRAETS